MKIIYSLLVLLVFNLNAQTETAEYYYDEFGSFGFDLSSSSVQVYGADLQLDSMYGLRNSSGSGGLNIDSSGNVKINGYDLHLADGNSYGLRNSSGSGGLKIDDSGDVLIVSDLTVVGNTIKSSSDTVMELSMNDVTFSDNVTVTGDVVISSDARLKSNIVSLGSTLSKLLLLDGKSYKMNVDGDQKIGVLAQDVQKVFPELVTKGDNEMLAVNYQGLVPVLINALKEQQKEIETYRNEVSELKKQFAEILN